MEANSHAKALPAPLYRGSHLYRDAEQDRAFQLGLGDESPEGEVASGPVDTPHRIPRPGEWQAQELGGEGGTVLTAARQAGVSLHFPQVFSFVPHSNH